MYNSKREAFIDVYVVDYYIVFVFVSYCNCNCNCNCVYYVSVCVKVCLLHIYILSKAIECLILFVCFDTPKLALQNAIIYSLGATRPYQDLDTYYTIL